MNPLNCTWNLNRNFEPQPAFKVNADRYTEGRFVAICAGETLSQRITAMEEVFAYDEDNQTMRIYSSPYSNAPNRFCDNRGLFYEVDLELVNSVYDLFGLTMHLNGKRWARYDIINEFVKRVCKIKNWNPPRRLDWD